MNNVITFTMTQSETYENRKYHNQSSTLHDSKIDEDYDFVETFCQSNQNHCSYIYINTK